MKESLSKRFHHRATAEWRSSSLPSEKDWPENWKHAVFKTYPRFEQIPLTEPLSLATSIGDVISTRKTTRVFDSTASISFAELSTLLFQSAGIRANNNDTLTSRRFYPSGGRRYPLEIYLSAERIEGLKRGLYHYNVKDNTLELLMGPEGSEHFKQTLGYEWCKEAAVMFLVSAVWERSFDKYRDFGYKMLCIESGHLTQNLQLVSTALSLGCTSLVGFREKQMDELLSLDPEIESSMYLTVIGKTRSSNQVIPSDV